MFVLNLLLLVTTVNSIFAAEPCETPNGQNGECKPINQCPLLYTHFERGTIAFSTNDYLRKSVCGYVKAYPKVCCPLGSSLPPRLKADQDYIITSQLLPNATTCGIGTESRIHGGEVAELDDFPWLVLLEYGNTLRSLSFGCTGALISKRYVLTARHCLLSNLKRVRLGEYNTETDPDVVRVRNDEDRAPPVVKIEVEERIPHEAGSDIGLIRLKKEVRFNDFVRPICLPLTTNHLSDSYQGKKLSVAGWGITEKEKPSPIKLKVQVPVRPLAKCEEAFKAEFNSEVELNDKHLCAGGERGKDSCNGDSGGPLMGIVKDENNHPRWYALGIVSFGPTNPCGQEGKPAIYVKVVQYVKWIVEHLRT